LEAVVDELLAVAQGRGMPEPLSSAGRQELKLIVY